jgi:N-acetyl-D-muramate 6-phosphate phosphatase
LAKASLVKIVKKLPFKPQAILFDLDGTLADTAADLAAPVNAMRVERGLQPLPLDDLRPYASMGARGLIGKGLGIDKDAPEFEALRVDFLKRYEADMLVATKLFDGFDGAHGVLAELKRHNIAWGVVSNKVERYVRPIMQALGVAEQSVCIVGGDTSGFSKPHPEPLLFGCRFAKLDPTRCIYVGDDLRDIEAGKAAGMLTIAAAYGFCGTSEPLHWGADFILNHPIDLINLI